MSPRELNPARVHATLARMRDLLADLDALVGLPTAAELEGDRGRRHIAERVLSQLVELAVSVNSHLAAVGLGEAPSDYRQSFDLVASTGAISEELAGSLRASAGLRNILVHEYLENDLGIVAAAIPRAHREFEAYIRQVAAHLGRH
jgi:uncharacterized protein YutE (UPF0331/DUF86 family)